MSPEATPDTAMRTLRAHLQQQPQFVPAPGTHSEKSVYQSLSPLLGAFSGILSKYTAPAAPAAAAAAPVRAGGRYIFIGI